MSEPNQNPPSKSSFNPASVAIVCAAAVIIVYLLTTPKPEAARRLWTPIIVETNGSQTILGDTRQMEFWTPSSKTKDFLAENGTVRDKDKWQLIPNDDAVMKFGLTLHTNGNILGYRRVEVWGHGRTSFKPGWWWSVNVTTNCPVAELTTAYETFWKPTSAVFIEVIDNRGSDK